MVAKKTNPKAGTPPPPPTQAYEAALTEFQAALELLHQGDFASAKQRFARIAEHAMDEPALAERARTFLAVCERRLAPQAAPPQGVDDLYHQAVLQSNNGEADAAIKLLDQALQQNAGSARLLYARASAWALKGDTEAAVADLRQAIAVEPTVRFQATNDSDFSQIREEPAFIDIIEPTSTGA